MQILYGALWRVSLGVARDFPAKECVREIGLVSFTMLSSVQNFDMFTSREHIQLMPKSE